MEHSPIKNIFIFFGAENPRQVFRFKHGWVIMTPEGKTCLTKYGKKKQSILVKPLHSRCWILGVQQKKPHVFSFLPARLRKICVKNSIPLLPGGAPQRSF